MKKLFIVMAVAACTLLTACGAKKEPAQETNAQIPNPWVDCGTLEEAAELAGFDIAVPDRIDGYPNTYIQAVKDEMIQVFYSDQDMNAEDRKTVLIRKGKGSEDISGDYNEYARQQEQEMHGVAVTLKGEGDTIFNAVWTQDGFAYSVSADEGLTLDQVDSLVELVK